MNPQPLFQHYDNKLLIRACLGYIVLYKRRYTFFFVVSFELVFLVQLEIMIFKRTINEMRLIWPYKIDITNSLLFCAFFIRIHLRSFFFYIFHFNPNAINFEIIIVSLFRLFYSLSIKLLVLKKFKKKMLEETTFSSKIYSIFSIQKKKSILTAFIESRKKASLLTSYRGAHLTRLGKLTIYHTFVVSNLNYGLVLAFCGERETKQQ